MYRKEIVYDRETRDYAMYLDGELVGFARTYHEAEITLDQLVFELLSGQYFRRDADQARELLETGALATATELDGGSQPGGSGGGDGAVDLVPLAAIPAGHRFAAEDEAGWWYLVEPGRQVWITDAPVVVYARPAEVAEPVYVPTAEDLLAQARGAETQRLIELFNRQIPTAYAASALYRRLAQAVRAACDAGDSPRVDRICRVMRRVGCRVDRRSTATHYDRYERSLETWLQANHADSWIASQLSVPATYARPADVAEPVYVSTAGKRILVFCERCGAPGTTADEDEDYICLDCLATQLSAVYARPAEPAAELTYVTLPAAPSQPLNTASVAPASPSPRDGSRQAHPGHDASTGTPTTDTTALTRQTSPAALDDRAGAVTASALWSLIRMTLDEWREFPHATPWDAQLAALDRAVYPAQAHACSLCASPHPTWNCPEIGDARKQQALGEDVWRRYREERDAFIETVRGADASLRREWAEALDAYFLATLGKSGGVSLFLKDWESLLKRVS